MADGDIKLILFGAPAFEALARAKDPDAALLYVYAAAGGGVWSDKSAGDALALPLERVKRAGVLLCLYGLAGGDAPAPENPAHPAQIAQARQADATFANLCGYLESSIGHILRRTELETLYNVYQNLGLPADVLVLLINFCKETRKLSAREIERQAYSWHDQGIDSYERAELHLESQRKLFTRGWQIRKKLGIDERKPSDSESRYISDWAQKAIPDDLISLAYDRTTARTGKLSWAYMDKILQTWREKGITSAKEAQKLDAARPAPPQTAGEPAESLETIVRRRFDERRRRREEQLKERITYLTGYSPEFLDAERRRRLCSSKLARSDESRRGEIERELEQISRERLDILRRLGKPDDWLDDRPKCAKCGDRGYIGARQCECFKEELERERANPL